MTIFVSFWLGTVIGFFPLLLVIVLLVQKGRLQKVIDAIEGK